MNASSISLAELKQLVDALPAMVACFDVETFTCVYANTAYAKLSGLSIDTVIGKTFAEITGEQATTEIMPYVEEGIRTNKPVRYVRAFVDASGTRRWIEVALVPNREPKMDRAYVLIFDITEHREAEIKAGESTDRLQRFFAASEEGIAFHTDGVITDVNPPLLRLLGYSVNEVIGRRTLDFLPTEVHEEVSRVIASGVETTYSSFVLTKAGATLPVEFVVRNMMWNDKPQRMVVVRDLSGRIAAEERIRFLALNDSLTGLPNRAQLDERLRLLIGSARTTGGVFATMFIDLDQVKRINDSLGHAAGDQLLIEVARRLGQLCSSANTTQDWAWLARLGGDEFVITFAPKDRDEITQFVQRLMKVFQQPMPLEHRELRVSASVGIALFPQDGNTPSQLLKNADSAMYLAKTQGRATVRYFDESLARAADMALEIEHELFAALEGRQFRVYYQPQLSANGTQLIGVEALIRWQHPTRGLISPDHFIEVAEDVHLILPMGQWVMDQSLAEVKRWRAAGWNDARVAVNLSSNQFRDADFARNIESALDRAQVPGDCLELELTERMVMGDAEQVQDVLSRLKRRGVTLSIDDFGTGLSSLSRLRSLPIDQIKIDQSFVSDLPVSHSALAIVTSLIQLGRGLSLQVVAEGVETEEQRECLDLLGCPILQGYLFAKPMSADNFFEWLSSFLARSLGRG
jgi:diguanylate cyclase (GGDEF)-like protein/PAS domain S-box-containing protein